MSKIINTLFRNDTNNPIVQFMRYGFTGFVAFLVDYSVLFALTEWGHLHYLFSAAIAYLSSAVINYLLSISWVFNRSLKDKPTMVIMAFMIIGAIGLGFTELLMWLLTDKAVIHYMLSKIIATAIVAIWNFTARRLFIQKSLPK